MSLHGNSSRSDQVEPSVESTIGSSVPTPYPPYSYGSVYPRHHLSYQAPEYHYNPAYYQSTPYTHNQHSSWDHDDEDQFIMTTTVVSPSGRKRRRADDDNRYPAMYPHASSYPTHPLYPPPLPSLLATQQQQVVPESAPVAPPAKQRKRRRKEPATTALADAAPCGTGPAAAGAPDIVQGAFRDSSNAAPRHRPLTISPREIIAMRERGRSEDSHRSSVPVFTFMRPLDSDAEPEGGFVAPDDEPVLTGRPASKYLGCRLCKHWKVYTNRKDGIISTLKRHLENNHQTEWHGYLRSCDVRQARTCGKQPASPSDTDGQDFAFDYDVFLELFTRWIVSDDQSVNAVENDAFRVMMAYLGNASGVDDAKIPRRDKMTGLIWNSYKCEYDDLLDTLQKSPGRLSFTTDLWSDPNLRSFMAITVHWATRNRKTHRLELASRLLAFRHLSGEHTGERLAAVFFGVLKEAGIAHKVGHISMDNASNCQTMMVHLEGLFKQIGIPFSAEGNRVRCFPHVMNIAVQTVLEHLKSHALEPMREFLADLRTDGTRTGARTRGEWQPRIDALCNDVVGRVRCLVAWCRQSGDRRGELRRLIVEGNQSKSWDKILVDDSVSRVNAKENELPLLQLLRDCETRWSSTFFMISRFLTLHQAIERLLSHPSQSKHIHNLLSTEEVEAVQDIYQLLEIPHDAQQILSSHHTPGLALAVPTYEAVIEKWTELKDTLPHLAHFIDIGIEKLDEYRAYARRTRAYGLAMALHPGMKLEGVAKYWGTADADIVRDWLVDAMIEYKLKGGKVRSTSTPASHAGQHQMDAFVGLTLGRRSAKQACRADQDLQASQSASQESESDESDRRLREARTAALQELRRYEGDGVLPLAHHSCIDVIGHWGELESSYPLIYRVALDILPTQATSVPSERVFSSSKETCTLRRSQLSTGLLEVLQVLKFHWRSEPLSFTSEWIANAEDYRVEGRVTEYAAWELIAAGKIEELADLYRNWID
ncbi:unnamed protein product [Peniophora sp. CBMAI 1063]|nr:unnamed protein product [Peniophora sp. CBMAI 1063]